MHELSIAVSMVSVVQEEARRHQFCVSAVHLRLGPLSGVDKHALLSAYLMACYDTPLENSRLIIDEVPIVIYCSTCQAKRTLPSIQRFCCPECATPTSQVVQGRELEVVGLEVE